MIPLPEHPDRRRWPILIGLGVSGLIHIGAMAGLAMSPSIDGAATTRTGATALILPPLDPPATPSAASPDDTPKPETKPEAKPEPKPEMAPVRAGIEDSNADSPNWQGFSEREATEHAAARSSVEQAALSLNPGNATPASEPVVSESPTPSPQPQVQALPSQPPMPTSEASAAAKAQAAPPEPEPKPEPRPSPEAKAKADAKPVDAAADAQPPAKSEAPSPMGNEVEEQPEGETLPPMEPGRQDGLADAPATKPDAAAESSDATPPAERPESTDTKAQPSAVPVTTPTPQASPSTPDPALKPATKGGGKPGLPGILADAESDASSIKEAIEYRLGKPVAGKGLKIRTVRPEWSMTTRLTASPRNPVVRVVFGRTGRVLDARFVKGQETGYADVDAPILHAVYRWTAKGEALDKLPAEDPKAGVVMTFRMILRE